MRTFFCSIVIFAAVVVICYADEFHEDCHPDATAFECISDTYSEVNMTRLKLVDLPFQCTRMFCHSDGSITGETCVPGRPKKGCYLTNPYLSLPYPHCCNFRQTCP